MKMKYLLVVSLGYTGLCAMQDVQQGKVKAAISKFQQVKSPGSTGAQVKSPVNKVVLNQKPVNKVGQEKKSSKKTSCR